MKPAFCSHNGASPVGPFTMRIAAEPAENSSGNRERHDELDDANAEIAKAGIKRERVALLGLREKKEMFAMDDAKLPPPNPQRSARMSSTT